MGDNTLKAYMNMFGNNKKSTLTNKDFSDDEIKQVIQAIFNKRYEVNNIPGYYQKIDYYNKINNNPRDNINVSDNAINYGNYSPNSTMSNVLGRFYYNTAPNGDITVTDRYDFNKAQNGEWYDPRNVLIQLGRTYGTPYTIQLNLGNPNSWGKLKYTGNSLINTKGQ